MKDKIRIAILDDHQIVIDGLKLLLKNYEHFEVILDCNDSRCILDEIEKTEIDVLLTDIMMPNKDGYQVAVEVKEKFPSVKIIALTMSDSGQIIKKMIDIASVEGYLLKTCTQDQLVKAIEIVNDNGFYYEDDIWDELEIFNDIEKKKQAIHFTPREVEIILLISKNFTNKEMAKNLIISERTIETHRKNIYRKSGTHTVVGLLEFARKNHFLV